MKAFCLVFSALVLSSFAKAQSWSFSLDPAGPAASAAAGNRLGWGYTITNDSTDQWLWATGFYVPTTIEHATSDRYIFDEPLLAPGTSHTVVYDQTLPAGLFELLWDIDAPSGYSITGELVVGAGWYDNDPLFGNGNYLSDAGEQTTSFTATVTPVPEPASLVGMSLAILSLRKRRR